MALNEPGIDVSAWQPRIDWQKVAAAGIQFVFVKTTEDEAYESPKAKAQIAGAALAGLAVGVYHFAQPSLAKGDPDREAVRLIRAHASNEPSLRLRPALDLEVHPGMDGDAIVAWAERFVLEVERQIGFTPIFYSYRSFILERAKAFARSSLGRCPLWLAAGVETLPAAPAPWTQIDCWQRTARGVVPGIAGRVDLDVAPNGVEGIQF